MQRAVVAIAVRKTGGLPELQAAIDSATQFAAWAREHQKIPPSRIKLITDARGAVSRDRIFDTIDKITELGFIEQLIVYFSGHGINLGQYEQWLLSRAPRDSAAAVDVKGSEFAARFCGIEHVIFISDACRTAAQDIQAQRVTGSPIFPNPKPSGPEKAVDQFYATRVGDPAYEVKTVQESTSRYRAAYSTVLMEALRGGVPALIESSKGMGYVRPRPLKRYLATAVPKFFHALQLPGGESAQPDARITSEPEAWISAFPLPGAATPSPGASGRKRAGRARGAAGAAMDGDETLPPVAGARRADTAAEVPSLEGEVSLEVNAALDPKAPTPARRAGRRASRIGETRQIYDALVSASQVSFGPDHMETQCGIKARGARIVSAYARYAAVSVGTQNDIVRVDLERNRMGANVLVQLTDGSCVLAPAFRDYLTGLTFDTTGGLQDVWCEPSTNTPLWRAHERTAGDLRRIRAVMAASSALGVFRLDMEQAATLLERLHRARAVDPALAVYAAHAFNDRRLRPLIGEMQRHLDTVLRVRIFDVAMLAFSLRKKPSRGEPKEMYPCVPMLTQGWALLSPLDITLPERLGELRSELRPSLWTHFTSDAAGRLHDVLRKGRVG
jgi:hypothetical protein